MSRRTNSVLAAVAIASGMLCGNLISCEEKARISPRGWPVFFVQQIDGQWVFESDPNAVESPAGFVSFHPEHATTLREGMFFATHENVSRRLLVQWPLANELHEVGPMFYGKDADEWRAPLAEKYRSTGREDLADEVLREDLCRTYISWWGVIGNGILPAVALILFTAIVTATARSARTERARHRANLVAGRICPDCRYDLKGCTGNICPECGAEHPINIAEHEP